MISAVRLLGVCWRKHPIANKARAGAVRYSATRSKTSSGILSMHVLASFVSVMMLWLWLVTTMMLVMETSKKKNEAERSLKPSFVTIEPSSWLARKPFYDFLLTFSNSLKHSLMKQYVCQRSSD